jgi:hypothetical protein
MTILVTATGYDPVAGGLAMRRWANGQGFRSAPRDDPPSTVWEPRVIQGGNYERHLFGRGRTLGRSEVGFGEVVINNADGTLDELKAWSWSGWPILIESIEPGGAYPDDAVTLLAALIGPVSWKRRQIVFAIRDRQAQVADKLLVEETYLGDNALPNGLEGVPEDLKGRSKPQPFGIVSNATLPIVNTSKLIAQVAARAGQAVAVTTLTDRGAVIAAGAPYATIADLLATAPVGATYRLYPGSAMEGAYLRLGSSPAGTLTADILEGDDGTRRTPGQVMRRLMERAGQPSNAIVGDAALDGRSGAPVGMLAGIDGLRCGEALDAIAGSAGAWWIGDRLGRLAMGRLELPVGEPAMTVDTSLILDGSSGIELLGGENDGQPAYRVTVEWGHNWTVQDADQLAGVALPLKNYRALEYRSVKFPATEAEEAAIKAVSPNAVDITVTTQLAAESDALALAAVLFERYRVARDVYQVSVPSERVPELDLGDLVRLQVPRFGLAGGKLFRVIGQVVDLARNVTTFILWG